jgi:hypothetical protein
MEEAMLAVQPPSTRYRRSARAAFDVHFRNAIEVLHAGQPRRGEALGPTGDRGKWPPDSVSRQSATKGCISLTDVLLLVAD